MIARNWLLVALSCAVMAPATTVEAADPIPVQIISAVGLPNVDNTTLNFDIVADLKNVLYDVAANDPAWGCIQVGGLAPDASYPVQLVVRADPGPSTEQYYVESVLTVKGQGTQKSPPRSEFLEGRPLEVALLTGLESQVRDLTASFEPCRATGQMHASLNWAQAGVSFAYVADGELSLTLQPDGSFDTETPVTSDYTFSFAAPCPGPQVGDTNPRMHLAGGYQASDGSLTIQTMEYKRDAWTYNSSCSIGGVQATCTYDSSSGTAGSCTMGGRSMPFSVPVPNLVGDLLGGSHLNMDLSDGAMLSIPPPAGTVGTWDASLQLAYPGT